MGISDYLCDARQSGNFLGCPLGIAAGHDDLAARTFSVDAPDGGASILIGGGGHRTCIEDDNLSFLEGGCSRPTAVRELALYSGAVRLGRSTAKILYVKSCHSHIVA